MARLNKDIVVPLALVIAMVVGGYTAWNYFYPTYTYRYRLTISVDTPAGVRASSGVIESSYTYEPQLVPGMIGFRTEARGDAIFLNLGDGRNVVALLTSHAFSLGAAYPQTVVLKRLKIPNDQPTQVAALQWRNDIWTLNREEYPALVTFADPADMTTGRVVSPDEFEIVFGSGFRLREINLAFTRDDVTREIADHLPWVLALVAGPYKDVVTGSPDRFAINAPYFRRN